MLGFNTASFRAARGGEAVELVAAVSGDTVLNWFREYLTVVWPEHPSSRRQPVRNRAMTSRCAIHQDDCSMGMLIRYWCGGQKVGKATHYGPLLVAERHEARFGVASEAWIACRRPLPVRAL